MIRTECGLDRRRFCQVTGIARATYYRRLGRDRDAVAVKGPWPTPVLERIDPLVLEVAEAFPFFGHRKVHGRLLLDGHSDTTRKSVERSMRRQGLLLPVRYQHERRQLAQARRAAFLDPPDRRNRVWQMDFAEFETEVGGVWSYAPVVDYWAKPALGAEASPTKTADDAINALRQAITNAELLLDGSLLADCTDPDTGEVHPVVVVTDNGSAFRAAFGLFIASRPELTHVRTRVRSPETNGVVERWIESSKYERLYREPVPDGLALQAQLDDYRHCYNHVRPHETLGQTLPITRYLAAPAPDAPTTTETKEAHIEPA